MTRTLKQHAKPYEEEIALSHDGAAVAILIDVETELPLAEVQEGLAAALSGPGEHLAFVQLRKDGHSSHAAAAHGLATSRWLAYVNTIEPPSALLARLAALFAGADWHKYEVAQPMVCSAEEAAATWARLWEDIKDQIHQPDEDGAVRVTPKGSEP